MDLRNMFAPTLSAPCVARVAAAAGLILAAASVGLAQTPPAKQQPKQAPAQPQPAQPPQAQPQPQGQAPQAQAPQPQDLPAVYTPWIKFCNSNPNAPQAKPLCLTVKEARLETGQFLAGAALLEQEGDQRKVFRVTVPLGMQLGSGTRVIIDQDQPISGQYFTCTQAGCLAEYTVNAEFVTKLKTGKQLQVQAINLQGSLASYPMPIGAEFAKANEGPPADPKQFEQNPQQQQQQQQKR